MFKKILTLQECVVLPYQHIMEHDLMSTNVLFFEGHTRKPDKSVLVHELENHFDKSDLTFTKTSKLETTLLIDFMSLVCRMPISKVGFP